VLIRHVDVDGRLADVTLKEGRVLAVTAAGPNPARAADVDGRGGAVLPGLHDHHIHLLAAAAARRSLTVGPPDVQTPGQLAAAIRAADADAPPGEWLRGLGYHESVSGPLGRDDLDRLVPGRPVRIQHRSGAMWMLNSRAIELLHLEAACHRGLERETSGRVTGRIYGMDELLRGRWGGPAPDLAGVGAQLLAFGITGVTDATPTNRAEDVELLAGAVAAGVIPQSLRITGGIDLDPAAAPMLPRGPVKLMVADHELPPLADLADSVALAHGRQRPVAIHCVSRVALVLAVAAWEQAGVMDGDRLEHGAVVAPEQAAWLAGHRVTVVTQSGFVAQRGDQYLAEVDAGDRPHLWPARSLACAGVALAGSSDAPFGDADPWRGMVAAVTRRTAGGRVLGPSECLSPAAALDLYLAPLESPGGQPRRVVPGAEADLVLLDAPLAEVLAEPSAERVVLTVRAGEAVFRRF
jgi:predicted amidohydrolase YtcJ